MRIYIQDRKRWRRTVFFGGWAAWIVLVVRLSSRDHIDLSRFVDMILFGIIYASALYLTMGRID